MKLENMEREGSVCAPMVLWSGVGCWAYLEDLPAVSAPVITETPDAVLMAVEDADLAIDGARSAPVTVSIEGYGLNNVLVAMLNYVKDVALLAWGGIS